jgi:hypothetical protein
LKSIFKGFVSGCKKVSFFFGMEIITAHPVNGRAGIGSEASNFARTLQK